MNQIKRILLLALVVFPISMIGKNESDTLQINGLEKTYHPNDSLLFSICNLSDNSVFFSIAIEEKISNQWVELSHDIFQNDFSKTTIVQILKPKGKQNVSWNILSLPRISMDDQDTSIKPIYGVFRFVIHWTIENSKTKYRYYSEEFHMIE